MTAVRRLRLLLVFHCSGLASAGLAQAPAATVPPPEARAADRLEALWRANGAPGVSVAVAVRGRIVFSAGRGLADLDNSVPATGDTVYDIGSVSKVMTATAVMQLVEQGKVRLEDPVQKYVPSFPDKGSPITIWNLMTHTSGIRHYGRNDFPGDEHSENMRPYASIEDAIGVFKNDPLLFPPGRYFSYSSYAVNLLQGVVEKASGMPFEDYMHKFVWDPAGMRATQFAVPSRIVPHRAKSYVIEKGHASNVGYGDLTYKFASGGMMSTVEDLVLFGTALNEGELLKPETLVRMYTPQIDSLMEFRDGKPSDVKATGQGLMWRIGKDDAGRRTASHSGAVQQFHTCLVNFPDDNAVVAMDANSYEAPGCKENLAFAEMFLPPAAQKK